MAWVVVRKDSKEGREVKRVLGGDVDDDAAAADAAEGEGMDGGRGFGMLVFEVTGLEAFLEADRSCRGILGVSGSI